MVPHAMNQLQTQSLQAFAEQVLFAETLAGKLTAPQGPFIEPHASSLALSSFKTPPLPSRPPGLGFSEASKRSTQHSFPTKSSLDVDRSRGLVLHFFANHELLALELMALAILKFPDAPWGFLKGIGQTMIEEQNHMRLYIERMKGLGVEFGEASLNGFFWRTLKEITTPQEYAAAMSLTFEQANLDFSLHFETEFRRLGDSATADILTLVRLEEIGHVKHGAVWLERWRAPTKSLWEEYISHLRFPLTPMRAKGPTFDREGRIAAGLPAAFIESLESFSASKGRPPRVFWFNPSCEDEIAHDRRFSPPKVVQELTSDLALTMIYLTHQDDLLLAPQKPTTQWLLELKGAGIEVPEILPLEDHPSLTKTKRKIASLEPWGWSPASHLKMAPLVEQIVSGYALPPDFNLSQDAEKNIFSKVFAANVRSKDDLPGKVCRTMRDVETAFSSLKESHFHKAVVKSPFGSSGRNKLVLTIERGFDQRELSWIRSQLSSFKSLVVEPWVERVADLSMQIIVSPDKEIRILGVTRFIVNSQGQYRGHMFGRLLTGLPVDAFTAWHASENGWLARFETTAKRVGQMLSVNSYHGPAGIDAFIYRKGDGFAFQSLCEINPRYTMGRVALELAKHCTTKTPGLWAHVSRQDIEKAGFESFEQFAQVLRVKSPLNVRVFSPTNRQLESGALCTIDPSLAKQILPVLILSDQFDSILTLLAELKLYDFFDAVSTIRSCSTASPED